MKIRIKGNTVRIRLSKTEVEKFGNEGYLEEHTVFGNGSFIYALRSGSVAEMTADIEGSKITMTIPDTMRTEWTSTEKVGYGHTISTKNGSSLYLLLEKDFKCTDPSVNEDQSDNYEHPNSTCV